MPFDPSSIKFDLVLTGLLGAIVGGFLTHYLTKDRESYARRYAFKEKQLSEFYGPELALVMQLAVGWELVEHLQQDRDKLIAKNADLDFESRERLLIPVSERHRKQYADQLELLKKSCEIIHNNLHLAEPETRRLLKPLVRFLADYETVREFGIPIDATGQEIASPRKPFSEDLKKLFYNMENVYKRLSKELRSGKLEKAEEGTDKSEFPVIDKAFPRPVLTVRKLGIRLGEKKEGYPLPAGNIAGSFQYTVPVLLVNKGTEPLRQFYLRIKVPTCFLIPGVTYAGSAEVDGEFTWFQFTENHRQIDLKPNEEGMACSLTLRVTRENHEAGNEPKFLEGTLGVTADNASPFKLSLIDLNLYDRFAADQANAASTRLIVASEEREIQPS